MKRLRWLLACLLPPLACSGQTPFRVDVKLVNVALSVRDARGALVTDLGQEDIEVLEDGVSQKIAYFARSLDVPLNLGLLADFSGSQDPFIKSHHKDLETFLQSVLEPADRAYLLCFGNTLRVARDFTSSPREILDDLRAFEKGARGYPEIGPIEERTAGTAFLDAIYHSAVQMFDGTERGRRAVVVFSDGEDNSSAHHLLDALEAAQNRDLVIYSTHYSKEDKGRPNSRNKYGASAMLRLARDTGGAYFEAREGEMAAHFRSIGEQLRQSYELGYYAANPAADGTFRKIAIRVKKPGLTVHAKAGYYAR